MKNQEIDGAQMLEFLRMARHFCIQRRPKLRKIMSRRLKKGKEILIKDLNIDLTEIERRGDITVCTVIIKYRHDTNLRLVGSAMTRKHKRDKEDPERAKWVAIERATMGITQQIDKVLLSKEKGLI